MTGLNQNDLINLNKIYHTNTASLHFIYGASKSGKTTFIRNFIVKKNILYLSFSSMLAKVQFPNIALNIAKKFNIKTSYQLYINFENILLLIDELISDEKIVVVLDDFDNLLKIDKTALEILIKIWSENLKKKNIQMIILSSVKFDDNLTKKITKISSFNFNMQKIYFADMIQKADAKILEKIYIYSCLGSSNHILSSYDKKLGFIKNLYNISMNTLSPFYNYGIDYLKINISDTATYATLLYAIAIGNNKIGEIALYLGVNSTYLTRYIKKLQDLMIIKKELPLKDKQKFSKLGRYHIEDNFLKFWFCYIYPNKISLDMKKHTPIIKHIDNSIVENIILPIYKELIKKLLKDNSLALLDYELSHIGSWWDNNGNNIDVISYNSKNITFIKVLWEQSDITEQEYDNLKIISSNYKTNLKRNYIIISKNTYLNNF
ncbi:MAG TPA: ATP-binding protein [Arcobacter sp.]|nr:ATP-binding protein [Arcobacter sp.]